LLVHPATRHPSDGNGRPASRALTTTEGGDTSGANWKSAATDDGTYAYATLYPATDPTLSSASSTENAEGYFLTRREMQWFYTMYLSTGAASAPEADLAHADLAGVAPAVVATAEFDPLRDEGAAYAERLAAAGVATDYVPGPGLIHGFAAFLGVVDAADATVAKALELFGRALRG
jgi:acetyl esterase